jgi:hypothetical protein
VKKSGGSLRNVKRELFLVKRSSRGGIDRRYAVDFTSENGHAADLSSAI